MNVEPYEPGHQLSLVHRYRPARRPSSHGKSPLLVLLHGVGSNEEDLLGLAPYFDDRFAVLSARAPHDYEYGGHAWFPLEWTPTGFNVDPAHVEESRAQLVDFLGATMQAYAARPSQTFLVGFSQGAIMSASVLLSQPDLIAGAVLMSGRIASNVQPVASDQLQGKPVMVVHGLYDEVIPVAYGRASRDSLQSLGLALTYREYPMGHQVAEESLNDIDTWLAERISDVGSD